MREIAREFLNLGATAYGGPAIMGIMQAELQEKRQLAVVLGHVVLAPVPPSIARVSPPTLGGLTLFLLQVGAFTFGGGLTMVAFIQEQPVRQWHRLTPQAFIDGLALGQLTPGAIVGTVAAFLPSFVLMLAILPVVERARQIAWAKAAMSGVGPAVIGALAVSLARLVPHAVPDPFAAVTLVGTVMALTVGRVGTFTLLLGGGTLGVLRKAYVWR